jgi:hypothetical protein
MAYYKIKIPIEVSYRRDGVDIPTGPFSLSIEIDETKAWNAEEAVRMVERVIENLVHAND